jgi:hypothetical protein
MRLAARCGALAFSLVGWVGCVGDAPYDECGAGIWFPDRDGDGFPNPKAGRVFSCEQPAGYVPATDNVGFDCDDYDADVHPRVMWHLDFDDDGFGDSDPANVIASCTPIAGRIRDGTDCNDRDETIFPSHPTCPLSVGGTSCLEILNQDPDSPDGAYRVDLDGPGPGAMATVWCDMTTDGGGWTGLIHPAVMPSARAPGLVVSGTTVAGSYDYCYGDVLESITGSWYGMSYMRCGDMTARMTVTWPNTIAADDVMFVATLQGQTGTVAVNGQPLTAAIQRLDGANAVCRFWNGSMQSLVPPPNQCWQTFMAAAPPMVFNGILAGPLRMDLTSGPACSPNCSYGAGGNIAKLFVR